MNELDLKIINAICDMKTNKQIASELNISVPQLNLKIKNIFKKFNVDSRFKLIYKFKTESENA